MVKRFLAMLLAMMLALGLLPAAQVQAISDPPVSYQAYFSEPEWELLKLVNRERSAEGLAPLTGFALLQEAAGIRAKELVQRFAHERPDGSGCFSAYEELDLRFFAAGENIAAGYANAEAVMKGWMNSPGHRSNILQEGFESVGLGYFLDPEDDYGHYWSQNFRGYDGTFTDYRLVMPKGYLFTEGTSLEEMDIYLVLEHSRDEFDHYLPLTEELVSGFTGKKGTMTVEFDLLGVSGSFEIVLVTDFEDVVPGQFYYMPVLWALEKNITSGVDATHFAPDKDCTRAQAVTFLWRAAGKPEPKNTSHPFVDVEPGTFYYTAMLWAVENSITSGVDATHFAPDKACTRAQAVTFLHRAKGKPAPTKTTHPFQDVNEKSFYYTAVLWAVENGITSGVSSTAFDPDSISNRGQVATFLYRTYNQ